uniref:Ig-like domain-containing protein n=1 Tax=Varanus komodoensis TaxID=61221 RepID=A0A8D2LB74_VARKO
MISNNSLERPKWVQCLCELLGLFRSECKRFSVSFTFPPVCCALEGPNAVTAPLGGPVTLLCKYGKGDEKLVKFWCKETNRRICSSDRIVRTTGSEAEVKWKRMSIKDNHLFHEFLVTMENLTQEDAGTYLCGVERSYDIWHKVEVNILSGKHSHVYSYRKKVGVYTKEDKAQGQLSKTRTAL